MPFRTENVPQKGSRYRDFDEDDDDHLLPIMIYQDLRRIFSKFGHFLKNFGLVIIFFLLIYVIIKSTVFMTESGYIYLYDNVWTGEIEVYDIPGIHFKIPFSQVTRYKQVWIVDFGTGYGGEQIRRAKKPIELRFADSYTATIPATFRYKLPRSKTNLERIHRDFTTQEKLVDAMLIPVSRDVMVITATQFTGEEFFQGGLNQFRVDLEDQLQNGIYQTERKQVDVRQRDLAAFGYEEEGMPAKSTSLKVWKTVPLKGKEGEILRLEKKSLVDYGIDVIQVTLGVPVPEPELEQLLADKKRFDRLANEKADELALIMEDQRIQLANIRKEGSTQSAHIEKDLKIQLAKEAKDEKIQLAQKAKALALVEKEKALLLAKKDEELALVHENRKIQLAKEEKQLAIELATTQAKKEEELLVAQENQKIHLANLDTQTKLNLAKKAEELAIVEKMKKIQLANVEKDKATQLAQIEKDKAMKLAKKAEELALVEEMKKIQLANVEKEKKIQLAKKEKEFSIIKEEQKIQVAHVEKDKQVQLAKQTKELALVQEEQKIELAQKAKDLTVVEAEKKIQLAQKGEELAIALEEEKIQQAKFESAQFEAKIFREKGIAEADVLKAKYAARTTEMYIAEIKKEIAAIIYPNLKGVNVTMPRNIVHLGEQDKTLQTNIDVLSSFATIGVMEGLEKKALDQSPFISQSD
jgi:hypothetical protein